MCVRTPSPGHTMGPKAHRHARGVKPRGPHREPASTGHRSREFGKQTSDERIERCLSGGTSQGVTSRGAPSLKEVDTWFGDILTTRVDGERANTVRWFPAQRPIKVFREGVGLEG